MSAATNFPFPPGKSAVKPAPAKPVVPGPAAPVVEQATAPVSGKGKVKKDGTLRGKPAPAMSKEQVSQVLGLVKENSYSDIATQLGITKHQVNRVLMETKKALRKAGEANPAMKEKYEAYIVAYLSRPEDTRPGHGGGRGGKVRASLEEVLGDILNSIK